MVYVLSDSILCRLVVKCCVSADVVIPRSIANLYSRTHRLSCGLSSLRTSCSRRREFHNLLGFSDELGALHERPGNYVLLEGCSDVVL